MMSEFVWLRIDQQADIWKVIKQDRNTLTVIHTALLTKKVVKLSDTVGHWVWYFNNGEWVKGFCYQRRGKQTLVKIPVSGFGKEVWVNDAVPLTEEESSDFAFEMMKRCIK